MTPTNDALNRWIAEFLEPKPSEPPRFSQDTSPNGGWRTKFLGFGLVDSPPNQVGYPAPKLEWQPRDFCADPACTVMLMEKLLDRGFVLTFVPDKEIGGSGKRVQLFVETLSGNRVASVENEPDKHAVALAFAKANGYQHDA